MNVDNIWVDVRRGGKPKNVDNRALIEIKTLNSSYVEGICGDFVWGEIGANTIIAWRPIETMEIDEESADKESADEESADDTDVMQQQVGGDHYKKHKIQPWHVVDEYNLDFYIGNTVKYLLREKGAELEDLQKAKHYLEKKISLLKH